MPSHLANFFFFFVFLVEMRLYHVGQTCLELLTSSDLPALASQSAGIIGVSHCAWQAPDIDKHNHGTIFWILAD